MKRGRPKGAGRWSAEADAHVWARITVIMERDQVRDVRRAARVLARNGFDQVGPDGKMWSASRPPKNPILAAVLKLGKRADKRMGKDDPAEVLRTRYYAAERRRKRKDETEFRDRCDALLEQARTIPPGTRTIIFTG